MGLFVNSHSIAPKDSSFLGIICLQISFHRSSFWLYVVKWRGKVDINISIDDADGIVLVFRCDFEDVDLKLILKDLDTNGVSLVQAGEVSKLVLEDGFRVLHVNEFGLMGL